MLRLARGKLTNAFWERPYVSFFLTIKKLIQALSVAWKDVEFRNVLILLLTLILSGTIFYSTTQRHCPVDRPNVLHTTSMQEELLGFGSSASIAAGSPTHAA
jgi:hypothetical protein